MKIIAAPDSFKGALSAIDAAQAIKQGVLKVDPNIEVVEVPVADGGEGTIDAIVYVLKGVKKRVWVSGPLGEKVEAFYGLCGETAVVEMAEAAGLGLVPQEKRNPKNTTTHGVGELILAALDDNVKNIIIGLGGSATTDMGCGMAQALGAKFYNGDKLITEKITGGLLQNITNIDTSAMDCRIRNVNIKAACDVNNPLVGENGASYIYSPQKGASAEDVIFLDQGLQKTGKILEDIADIAIVDVSGAGAAGGLGAGVIGFLGGSLISGADMVLDVINFDEIIEGADLIIFGEGKFDAQSLMGKIGGTMALLAKDKQIPFIVAAGSVKGDVTILKEKGITAAFSTADGDMSLDYAMGNAGFLLEKLVSQIISVFSLIKS